MEPQYDIRTVLVDSMIECVCMQWVSVIILVD